MKLILIPLTVLVLLSVFSMLGLGQTELGTGRLTIDPQDATYYDEDGNPKIYVSNLTAYVETDPIKVYNLLGYACFENGTYMDGHLYFTPDGDPDNLVPYEDLGQTQDTGIQGVDITSSLGLIGVVIGVIALAAIVGLRVLGSGVSDVSVSTILQATILLLIWGVFSVLALDLILQMELLGPILYFGLTIMYTTGFILRIGGSSNE